MSDSMEGTVSETTTTISNQSDSSSLAIETGPGQCEHLESTQPQNPQELTLTSPTNEMSTSQEASKGDNVVSGKEQMPYQSSNAEDQTSTNAVEQTAEANESIVEIYPAPASSSVETFSVRMMNADDRLAVSIGTINIIDSLESPTTETSLKYATAEELYEGKSEVVVSVTSSESPTSNIARTPSPRKSSKKPASRRSSGRISEIRRMKAEKLAELRRQAEMESIVDNREGKDRKPTGLVYEERMLLHMCPWDPHHIETPDRLSSIWTRCLQLGLVDKCTRIPAREATDDEVKLYHSDKFLSVFEASRTASAEENRATCSRYDSVYLCPDTATAARLATGAGIDLVDDVLSGKVHNGMGLVRPPGHHAMEDELNGFCGYNNIVIAAKSALDKGLKKILILDFDLHHGQGVQRAFYEDSRVLYMSVHRYEEGRYWPHLRESNFDYIGSGPGTGFNVNVPLNVTGCGNAEYLAIFQRIFLPIATEYNPDLVLVSAGYDAAIGCPEGCMNVTPAAYSHFIQSLGCLAGGRLVVLLEGGYCLDSLSEAAALTLRSLTGAGTGSLPSTGAINPSVLQSILGVTTALRPYWKSMQLRPILTSLPSAPDGSVDVVALRHLYPSLRFDPPVGWPPQVFPTSDYYLVFDKETEQFCATEIAKIKLNTRLRDVSYRVCVGYDELMCRHRDDGPHPEAPERIVRIYERIKDGGFFDQPDVIELAKGRKLNVEEALLVHSQQHWDTMIRTVEMEEQERDDLAEALNSIYLNEFSLDCGLLSAGAVLDTVDRVLADCRTGLAIVRPPGHHAEEDEAHGFCVFNNVGIAAQYAIKNHGVKRVLILDWDVHHGNGIQHMFYNNNQVLYISIHRYDYASFFPCSEDAGADMVGEGAGVGYNVNIPWNSRKCGDLEYFLAFMNIVMPIAYEYNPELVLVAAGFDAARGDPLGGFRVTPAMYGLMTHHLTGLADGKVIVALEGGYNFTSISESMYMCARALRGDPLQQVILDSPLRDEVVATLQDVLQVQQKYWRCLENTTLSVPEEVNLLSEFSQICTQEEREGLAGQGEREAGPVGLTGQGEREGRSGEVEKKGDEEIRENTKVAQIVESQVTLVTSSPQSHVTLEESNVTLVTSSPRSQLVAKMESLDIE